MIIGVPKEIKQQENRIGAVPATVHDLVAAGHRVLVQKGGGLGAGISDESYLEAGAELVDKSENIWARSEMIMKVKEPLAVEWPMMKKDQVLFTYFHFAADRKLTDAVLQSGAHAFAYETLTDHRGQLPLLTPMSEVAGRMAIQVGAHYLERSSGGRGVLLGGVPGTEPGTVLILGGGVVGTNAAKMAAGLGARVILLDISLHRLRELSDIMPANVTTQYSTPFAIREWLTHADLVVGAVLLPGARAPLLVKKDDLKHMREGSVVVDVAVDQGGCIETCKPTTHANPTYVVDGVLHYCVANMPGAVPRTSTFALNNATALWAVKLAGLGAKKAAQDKILGTSANILGGKVTCKGVAAAFNLEYVPPESAL